MGHLHCFQLVILGLVPRSQASRGCSLTRINTAPHELAKVPSREGPMEARAEAAPSLKRSLTLTHAVLYGLGVTVGAGIYVLIAAAAGRAGLYAPISFVLTAALIAFTGASLAELGGRMPVAAGEAAYVRRAFRFRAHGNLRRSPSSSPWPSYRRRP